MRLEQHLPEAVYALARKASHARPSHRRWAARRASFADERAQLDEQVVAAVGSEKVQRGPLSGLHLSRESAWGLDYSARLVGAYEMELHPSFELLLGPDTPRIVDVGCADGYYVAGLGRLAEAADVDAYDIDPAAQAVTMRLAELNGLADRVRVHGRCDPADLCGLPDGTLVVMDCEGAESVLITDAVARSNPRVNFIIECHDSIVPGVSAEMRDRFAGRELRFIWPRPRVPTDAPMLPAWLAERILDERRSAENPWLVVT